MADFTKTASTGIVLCQHAAAAIAEVAVLDVSQDFLVFDGHVAVTYRELGVQTKDVAGNVVRTGYCDYPVPHAITRKVTDRDVRLNEGWLRVTDIWFELWQAELPVSPKIGDEIYFQGIRYKVVGFGQPTIRTRWQFAARR